MVHARFLAILAGAAMLSAAWAGESAPLVSDVVDLRAAGYHGEALKKGTAAYTDRSFPLDNVPEELSGAIYLRLPNDCKGMRSGGAVFALARPATVYVCYDGRAESLPNWIEEGGFAKTELEMIVGAAGEYPFFLYARDFPAGPVQLGPNCDDGGGAGCMYGVAVKEKAPPAEGAPPLVSGVGYARGAEFHGVFFEDRVRTYTDRPFSFKDVPEGLKGAVYVATPMGARDSSDQGMVFSLSARARVLLGLPEDELPAWAGKLGFKKTDLEVTVTELQRAPDFKIPFYAAELEAGRHVLGANRDEGRKSGNTYVLAVQGSAEQNRAGVVSGVPAPRPKAVPPPNPKNVFCDDASQWTVTIYAGNPSAGPRFQQGPLLETNAPGGFYFAPDGTQFALAGSLITVVRDGSQRLFAGVPGMDGHRDGPARAALFSDIGGMRADGRGGYFVFDRGNLCFRRLFKDEAGRWTVETVAGVPGQSGYKDGPAREALFKQLWSMAVDSKGVIYTFDGNWLRRIADGKVETLNSKGGGGYKDGPIETARFQISPGGGSCIDEHDVLFLADRWNHCIRKIDLAKNEVTTAVSSPRQVALGGWDGPEALASFGDSPGYIAYDPVRKCYYTNGVDEDKIRRWSDGWIKTLIGCGKNLTGPATNINMFWCGVNGIDPKGDLYFHDSRHKGIIRKATFAGAAGKEE